MQVMRTITEAFNHVLQRRRIGEDDPIGPKAGAGRILDQRFSLDLNLAVEPGWRIPRHPVSGIDVAHSRAKDRRGDVGCGPREGYSIEIAAATSPVRCSIDAVGRVGRQVPDEDRHPCVTVTPPMGTGGECLVSRPVQRYGNRGEGIAQGAARSLEVAYRNGGGFSNATVRGSDIPRG